MAADLMMEPELLCLRRRPVFNLASVREGQPEAAGGRMNAPGVDCLGRTVNTWVKIFMMIVQMGGHLVLVGLSTTPLIAWDGGP